MYVCYFIKTIIDYEVNNLLRTFSYGILICFKCFMQINRNYFMQINRNYICIKLYNHIYKKEMNLVALDEF